VQHISSSARKALILIVASIGVYLVTLLSIKDVAIGFLLTKEYSKLNTLILLWGCLFLAQAFRSNYSALLQVFEKFRAITLLNMASATVVILSSIYLIGKLGADGSIVGMILGEIILSKLLFDMLKKTISASP
jgi:O-antigen/teichoic acid export membrane protein